MASMPARPDLTRPDAPIADMFAAARQRFAEFGHERDIGAPVTQVLCWGGSPAFAAGDGCLHVLAVNGGGTAKIEVHGGAILSACCSPDGREVLSGGDDGFARIAGVDGVARDLAKAGRGWMDHVAWSPWGCIALASGREVQLHADGITRKIELPSACGRLAIAHYGGATLVSPAPAGWTTQHLAWKGSHIGVTWSPDCRFVLTVMQESALHGWRLADQTSLHMGGFPAKPRSLSWSRNGHWLATSGGQGLLLWPFKGKDGPMGHSARQLVARDDLAGAVAFHPKGRLIAVGYGDGVIVLLDWAAETMAVLRAPDREAVHRLLWAPDGTWLAFAAGDSLAGVINTAAFER
jgi:WD40 repeat protein